MRYVALAAGYDGTLAEDGRCDERCIEALRALAATGRKLILVTARELRELLEIFPEARLFDFVVAENGAVMYRPATRESAILAQAPSEILLQDLERRGVKPIVVGSSSITTVQSHAMDVHEALEKLALEHRLMPNGALLSILPAEVDKAFGVRSALKELGVSAHNLIAIGDGENDVALFALAEHAAAVRNAHPALLSVADRITQAEGCEGFLELARELIANDVATSTPRTSIILGADERSRITLAPARDSLLVYGPPGSGKTAICEHLLEQFLMQDYQCCLLAAESLPIVRSPLAVFGEQHEAPRLTDVLAALENPAVSASVNLAALAAETRPLFTEALLLQLQALHDRVGRPHCVLIQQAENFIAPEFVRTANRIAEITMIYSSANPELLPPDLLSTLKYLVAAGGQSATPLAWRERVGESVQAMTGGGAFCWISALRPALGSAAASLPIVLSG